MVLRKLGGQTPMLPPWELVKFAHEMNWWMHSTRDAFVTINGKLFRHFRWEIHKRQAFSEKQGALCDFIMIWCAFFSSWDSHPSFLNFQKWENMRKWIIAEAIWKTFEMYYVLSIQHQVFQQDILSVVWWEANHLSSCQARATSSYCSPLYIIISWWPSGWI